MTNMIQPLRVGAISAIAGVALLGGGLFLSGALVSAEETPTPAPGQTQTAAPGDEQDGTRTEGDCPKDDASGSSTGVRSRGGPRSQLF